MTEYCSAISSIQHRYDNCKDIQILQQELLALAFTFHEYFGVGDHLIYIGEQYISQGDYDAGIIFIKTTHDHFHKIANKTTLYLRMAEYYIKHQSSETGIQCLITLCTKTVDNYEEAIELNELTDIWLKYKHLVEGKVPESIRINSAPSPIPPNKCRQQIGEIFDLPEDDIISALSAHLGELSANGEYLTSLNKWEKTVFYADELCMEVNSGGFGGYLYYHGNHFEKAYNAWKTIQADKMISLLDQIVRKFPCGKIPKSIDRLQAVLDVMEEKDIDFECEDAEYYENIEKASLPKLLDYILNNRNHFR